MVGNAGLFRRHRTGFSPHQMVEFEGQIALLVLGIQLVQALSTDQAENPVAKELQPLVRVDAAGTGVGERPGQQLLVGKQMAEPFFQLSR